MFVLFWYVTAKSMLVNSFCWRLLPITILLSLMAEVVLVSPFLKAKLAVSTESCVGVTVSAFSPIIK